VSRRHHHLSCGCGDGGDKILAGSFVALYVIAAANSLMFAPGKFSNSSQMRSDVIAPCFREVIWRGSFTPLHPNVPLFT